MQGPAGGVEPRPYEGLQGVRCGEESPTHGFAVPAPFRQGGRGDRGRIATASVRTGFAMTHCKECVGRAVGDAGPYGIACRGGRLCPPGAVGS